MNVFNHMVNNTAARVLMQDSIDLLHDRNGRGRRSVSWNQASKSGDFVAGPNAEQAANPSS